MCPRLTGYFNSDWHCIQVVWQSGDFTLHFLVLGFNLIWHRLTKLNTKWCSSKIKVSSTSILLFQVRNYQFNLQFCLTEKHSKKQNITLAVTCVFFSDKQKYFQKCRRNTSYDLPLIDIINCKKSVNIFFCFPEKIEVFYAGMRVMHSRKLKMWITITVTLCGMFKLYLYINRIGHSLNWKKSKFKVSDYVFITADKLQ